MVDELSSGSPGQRLELAGFLLWSQRHAGALEILRDLRLEGPETVEGALLCGYVEYGRKAFREAADHFARVLRHAPRHFKAAANYSHCLLHLRRWADADDFLAPFVRRAPAAGVAGVSCAVVSLRLGRLRDACRTLVAMARATAGLREKAGALARLLQATELDLAE